MEIFGLISEVGFPIVGALAAGYFVFLTLKFILAGVTGSVNGLKGIIMGLDNRVKNMNNDMIKLDIAISDALNLRQDEERISRADGKEDARRD